MAVTQRTFWCGLGLLVLCLAPGQVWAQAAFLRLLLPANKEGFQSKHKRHAKNLQLRLQKLESQIDARKQRAAIDKQIFEKELLEYNQLLIRNRRPTRVKSLETWRWRQKLLQLAQLCISDLMRTQSVEHLIDQSRVDLQEALRMELEARLQLKEYLKKTYHWEQRAQLVRRIKDIEERKQQSQRKLRQIAQDRARHTSQQAKLKKKLDRLRRELSVPTDESPDTPLSPASRPAPEPSLKPGTTTRQAASAPSNRRPAKTPTTLPPPRAPSNPWETRVLLLRLNRYRIRIRLLQLLQQEERLNEKVSETRLRFYNYSLNLMRRQAKRLARLSKGGLLYLAPLPASLRWSDIAAHTQKLRTQGLNKATTGPHVRSPSPLWEGSNWLYLAVFFMLVSLLVLMMYRISQRAIDRLTQRAQEERLLLQMWRILRLSLRILRDTASWMLLLLPALWLIYTLFPNTLWWVFAKNTTFHILVIRLSWTACQRLFHADPKHRLFANLDTKSARRFRRVIKALLLFHGIVFPCYRLLTLLQYPHALLEWVFVCYLAVLVGGGCILLFQKDSMLNTMPKNTVLERILIVAMYRLYPLVWMTPLLLFGTYLWGYRNLAAYFARGIFGSLGLIFLTDLLAALLWGMMLWLLGFTNEDESLLQQPVEKPQQVELDPTEGGPLPQTPEPTEEGQTPEPAKEAPTQAPEPAEGGPTQAPEPAKEAPTQTPEPTKEGATQAPESTQKAPEASLETQASSQADSSGRKDRGRKPGQGIVTPKGLSPAIVPYFRIARIFYLILVAFVWFGVFASLLELWQVPGGVKAIPAAFTYPIFQAVDLQISLWVLLKVFGIFALTLWLSKVIPDLLNEYLYPTLHISQASSYVTNALLRYFLMSLGIFFCLQMLNVSSRGFLILLAVFGLSLSYGMRKLMHNFVSSLLILFGRSIEVGDYIETVKHKGKVKKITARSVTLQTSTGKLILIPTGRLLDDPIINWLAAKPYFRDRVVFYIALDSDVNVVQEILLRAAKDNPDVQKKPAPTVRLREMDGGALEFGLTVTLLNPMAPGRIRSALRLVILEQFRKAGVELALPQQELHLHPDIEAGLRQQLRPSEDDDSFPSLLPPLSRWQSRRPASPAEAQETKTEQDTKETTKAQTEPPTPPEAETKKPSP